MDKPHLSSPRAFRRRGQEPPIPSASQMPNSPTKVSMSPLSASPGYVKSFHALIEHQREVHSEERALWHIERAELHEKIAQLEASLRRYLSFSPAHLASPIGQEGSGGDGSIWDFLSADGPRHSSTTETGDEVWRPRANVKPTRTFPDTPNQAAKSENQLPSITEDAGISSRKRSQETFIENKSATHKASISGSQIDSNLDGINFKPGGLTPATVKNIMTPQSPSPQSPSPSKATPGTIDLPSTGLLASENQYTKDAGHTPLARRTNLSTDGAASAHSSQASTPTQPEMERPPLEPRTTSVKVPSERSESYFPVVEANSGDDDPALTGPLGLTNDQGEDKLFLKELDSKLSRAARSESLEPPTVADPPILDDSTNDKEREFDQPEEEPKLRIKRSMNFGSAFGAKNPGKGI